MPYKWHSCSYELGLLELWIFGVVSTVSMMSKGLSLPNNRKWDEYPVVLFLVLLYAVVSFLYDLSD